MNYERHCYLLIQNYKRIALLGLSSLQHTCLQKLFTILHLNI